MLVFSAVRNVKVFHLGATIHGVAGILALTTANWRLWHTRNWEMTLFSESPFTVHLVSIPMESAVNTTYSLEDVTALNQLLLKLFMYIENYGGSGVCGIQFPLKWAGFVMPRLKANCYLEIFKFQFMSNSTRSGGDACTGPPTGHSHDKLFTDWRILLVKVLFVPDMHFAFGAE